MEDIKEIIRSRLEAEQHIKLCILYGSAAKDRLTERSDIDIAVAGDDKLDTAMLADLQMDLSQALNREVDLVDMNRAEGLILQKIIQTGTVLVKRDSMLYAGFIKKVIYFDADVLPNIRMILKKRAEKFVSGY